MPSRSIRTAASNNRGPPLCSTCPMRVPLTTCSSAAFRRQTGSAKITPIEPQQIECNVARRLAVHHQRIEIRTAFAEDNHLSIEDCMPHLELLRDRDRELVAARRI